MSWLGSKSESQRDLDNHRHSLPYLLISWLGLTQTPEQASKDDTINNTSEAACIQTQINLSRTYFRGVYPIESEET